MSPVLAPFCLFLFFNQLILSAVYWIQEAWGVIWGTRGFHFGVVLAGALHPFSPAPLCTLFISQGICLSSVTSPFGVSRSLTDLHEVLLYVFLTDHNLRFCFFSWTQSTAKMMQFIIPTLPPSHPDSDMCGRLAWFLPLCQLQHKAPGCFPRPSGASHCPVPCK